MRGAGDGRRLFLGGPGGPAGPLCADDLKPAFLDSTLPLGHQAIRQNSLKACRNFLISRALRLGGVVEDGFAGEGSSVVRGGAGLWGVPGVGAAGAGPSLRARAPDFSHYI